MKVDGLGVILAIILLPIILIVSYYIQLQVDTIAKQNSYNTKLLNATHDAMYAFESNTADEELSSVADSMRSIILASNNVLLNSLSTQLGISNASREHLQPYIPAVLYTLYDGYYIYAPTETKQVAEKVNKVEDNGLLTLEGYLSVGDTGVTQSGFDYKYKLSDGKPEGEPIFSGPDYGDILYKKKDLLQSDPNYYQYKKDGSYTFTADPNEAAEELDYVLKSYVQYSARYVNDENSSKKIDVTINYTLDNYLNIVGTIGDVYYTKTGYLIKKNLVKDCYIKLKDDTEITAKNENFATEKILGVKTTDPEKTIDAAKEASVKINEDKIEAKWENITKAIDTIKDKIRC